MRPVTAESRPQDRPWIDGRDASRQLASGALGARLMAAARAMLERRDAQASARPAGEARP